MKTTVWRLLAVACFAGATVQALGAAPPRGSAPKRTATPAPLPAELPDLVVSEFVATGPAVVRPLTVDVPVKVVIKNVGTAAAGRFTVCAEPFPLVRVPPVPGPVIVAALASDASIEIQGKIAIPIAQAPRRASLKLFAKADCCRPVQAAGCSVVESREDNNVSAPLFVQLP